MIVTLSTGDDPDSLSASLDKITGQLAAICNRTDAFKGYMIREQSESVAFLITADADGEAHALSAAISWLHTAVIDAGFATPGWLKRAEQVYGGAPA